MLTAEVFHSRRQRLSESVGRPILLCGSGNRARNLPMNILPFRQDSTFLYFTGCSIPDAAAYVLGSTCVLFLPSPADDDPLWHGEVPNHAKQRTIFGVDKVEPLSKLPEYLGAKDIATLAVPDEQRNQWLQERIGIPLRFGMEHGDSALVDAVIQMRLTKGPPGSAL